MKAPCKGCADRKLGCHSSCEEYLEFRKAQDEINEQRKSKEAEENWYSKKQTKYLRIKKHNHYR